MPTANVVASVGDAQDAIKVLDGISTRIDEALAELPTHASIRVDGMDHRFYLRQVECKIADYIKAAQGHADAISHGEHYTRP